MPEFVDVRALEYARIARTGHEIELRSFFEFFERKGRPADAGVPNDWPETLKHHRTAARDMSNDQICDIRGAWTTVGDQWDVADFHYVVRRQRREDFARICIGKER